MAIKCCCFTINLFRSASNGSVYFTQTSYFYHSLPRFLKKLSTEGLLITLRQTIFYIISKLALGKDSTSTAVTDFTEHIRNTTDYKIFSVAVLLDIKKTFHTILLKKLESNGIWGTPLTLIKNSLKGRKQYIFFKDSSPGHLNFKIGVPQGYLHSLGPLISLI